MCLPLDHNASVPLDHPARYHLHLLDQGEIGHYAVADRRYGKPNHIPDENRSPALKRGEDLLVDVQERVRSAVCLQSNARRCS
jgi:hypothetical protein